MGKEKEDDKPKRQPPWSRLQWAGGATLCVLGVGAWAVQQGHLSPSPHHRPPPLPAGLVDLPLQVEPKLADAPREETDSLEDALRSLEGEETVDVVPLKRASRASKKAKRQPAAAGEKKAGHGAREALEKLEGTAGTRKAKASEEIAESAAEKPRKAQKPKVSDEDTQKAQAILKDAMDKLDGDGDADLRARLEALLAGEGDGPAAEQRAKKPEPAPEEDAAHMDFVKLLQEETARQHEHTLPLVKSEFARDFAGEGRGLLCSGCKLVAARFGSELDNHDVHESENPALMLASKRRALDATCASLRHLHVVRGERGLRFEAGEAPEDGHGTPGAPQRLCLALLEESRFDVMTKLIQTKMPSLYEQTHQAKHNWERWLCAQRTRLCKRSEVREDDEDDEEL